MADKFDTHKQYSDWDFLADPLRLKNAEFRIQDSFLLEFLDISDHLYLSF